MPTIRERIVEKMGPERARTFVRLFTQRFYSRGVVADPEAFPEVSWDDATCCIYQGGARTVIVDGMPTTLIPSKVYDESRTLITIRAGCEEGIWSARPLAEHPDALNVSRETENDSQIRRGRGRPPGSKNKPKEPAEV